LKDFEENSVVEKKASLLKLGCLFAVFLIGFWIVTGVLIGLLVSRMIVMPYYVLPKLVHQEAVSCRKKIMAIEDEAMGDKVTISEHELNSFFPEEYRHSVAQDIYVTLVPDEIKLAFNFVPMNHPEMRAQMQRYIPPGDDSLFEPLREYVEAFKLRVVFKARLWTNEAGDADFEFVYLNIGIQRFPAGFASDIIKRFLPNYRMFLGIEGVDRIVFGKGDVTFFPEKDNL